MNRTLYNKILLQSNEIAKKVRSGYANYMIVNSRLAYEINRLNLIQERKRKLKSL